jgi:hypothetical protein
VHNKQAYNKKSAQKRKKKEKKKKKRVVLDKLPLKHTNDRLCLPTVKCVLQPTAVVISFGDGQIQCVMHGRGGEPERSGGGSEWFLVPPMFGIDRSSAFLNVMSL